MRKSILARSGGRSIIILIVFEKSRNERSRNCFEINNNY
jgi:hypothetical protein